MSATNPPASDAAPPGPDFDAAPFDRLDEGSRERLRGSVDMALFRAGERLIDAGEAPGHVYVVFRGRVLASDLEAGGEQPFSEYGAGDVLGAYAALHGRARHRYVAQEDTLAWTIPSGLFADVARACPGFGAYFDRSSDAKRRALARRDLPADLGEVMMARIGEGLVLDAVTLAADASIADAVAAMRRGGTDAVLVEDGARCGIATRTDLLDALALRGARPDHAIGAHASFPVRSLDENEPLFQALVTMTERGIHRVVVTRDGAVRGTLGLMEVLGHFSGKSHVIAYRLQRARSLVELRDAAADFTPLVRTLAAQGARSRFLMQLLGALHERLLARVFELRVPESLRDRLALLVLGSEGRREQILKTDQDNALVLADDLDGAAVAALATAISEDLVGLGWPPCPGGVMVRNAAWRRTRAAWVDQVRGWARRPDAEATMHLAILFDARCVAGDAALLDPVRDAMYALADDAIALREFVRPAVEGRSPLTLFGGLRSGAGGVDVKRAGVFPIVHGLRTLALAHQVDARNSFARAEALVALGQLDERFARDLTQALAVCVRLRLSAQLASLREGATPGNHLDPGSLRRLDRDLLRDALRVVAEFQGRLRGRFTLD